jgi:hypothetical protein
MCHSSVRHSAEFLSVKSHTVEYHSAECHSSKFHSAKCRSVRKILLNVALPETFQFITKFCKLRTKTFIMLRLGLYSPLFIFFITYNWAQ